MVKYEPVLKWSTTSSKVILVCGRTFQSLAPVKSSVLLRWYSMASESYFPTDRAGLRVGPWKMFCEYPAWNDTLESGRIVRLVSVILRTVLNITGESLF